MTQIDVLILINVLSVVVLLTQEVRLVTRKKELYEVTRLLIDVVRVLDSKGIVEIVERGGDDE